MIIINSLLLVLCLEYSSLQILLHDINSQRPFLQQIQQLAPPVSLQLQLRPILDLLIIINPKSILIQIPILKKSRTLDNSNEPSIHLNRKSRTIMFIIKMRINRLIRLKTFFEIQLRAIHQAAAITTLTKYNTRREDTTRARC